LILYFGGQYDSVVVRMVKMITADKNRNVKVTILHLDPQAKEDRKSKIKRVTGWVKKKAGKIKGRRKRKQNIQKLTDSGKKQDDNSNNNNTSDSDEPKEETEEVEDEDKTASVASDDDDDNDDNDDDDGDDGDASDEEQHSGEDNPDTVRRVFPGNETHHDLLLMQVLGKKRDVIELVEAENEFALQALEEQLMEKSYDLIITGVGPKMDNFPFF